MALRQKTHSGKRPVGKNTHFSLPIGVRLSLAFMVIILLTGLIGLLAIEQFSSLTNTTTELNAHDLPEAIALVHLHSLLYRQRDLERSLLTGDSLNRNRSSPSAQQGATTEDELRNFSTVAPVNTPEPTPTTSAPPAQSKQTQQTLSELALVLRDIDRDRQHLLAFENPHHRNVNAKDFPLVHKVADGILKMRALSERIQALIPQGQFAQARTLDVTQQEPLRIATIAAVTQLVTIEQAEAANDAAQAQQESGRSTLYVLALTALGLLLSIVLAIIITRSLTRPLGVLLDTTEAIAAGNLHVASQVARSDEIGRLAAAFDKMRVSLRSMIASLSLERQQTQAIIDATADGVIVVDGAYKIVTCNPAAEHVSGWPANEAIGKYCWEVLGFKETSVQEAEAHEPLSQLLAALQTRSEQSLVANRRARTTPSPDQFICHHWDRCGRDTHRPSRS